MNFAFLLIGVVCLFASAYSEPPVCCVSSFDPSIDLFPTKLTTDFADHFTVEYFNWYKVVTVTTNNFHEEYVLYQCGTPVPTAADSPRVQNITKFFQIPVKRVSTESSTQLPYFEELGVGNAINYATIYASSPCLLKRIEESSTLQYEDSIAETDLVDVLFHYDWNFQNVRSSKLAVLEFSSGDPGIVHRFEWIEFYSLFFNLEAVAQGLEADMNRKVLQIENEIATLQSGQSKPKCAWLGYYQGFYTSSSEYIVGSRGALSLGGCEVINSEFDWVAFNANGGNNSFALDFVCSADLLVFELFGSSIDLVANWLDTVIGPEAVRQNIPCAAYENKKAFNIDRLQGPFGYDFYETNVARGDEFILDIALALYPTDQVLLNFQTDRLWLRRIIGDVEPIKRLSSANCSAEMMTLQSANICVDAPSTTTTQQATTKSTTAVVSSATSTQVRSSTTQTQEENNNVNDNDDDNDTSGATVALIVVVIVLVLGIALLLLYIYRRFNTPYYFEMDEENPNQHSSQK